MVTPDYWGDLQLTTEQMTPVQILQEQASALNERTAPRIRASVATKGLGETLDRRYDDASGLEQKLRSTATRGELEQKLCSTLAITVPSLKNYHLDIVTVIYPYPLRDYYPLVLSDDLGDKDDELSECNSEQEFRDQLQKMLSSKRTTDTLKSLLSLTGEEILSDDDDLPF